MKNAIDPLSQMDLFDIAAPITRERVADPKHGPTVAGALETASEWLEFARRVDSEGRADLVRESVLEDRTGPYHYAKTCRLVNRILTGAWSDTPQPTRRDFQTASAYLNRYISAPDSDWVPVRRPL